MQLPCQTRPSVSAVNRLFSNGCGVPQNRGPDPPAYGGSLQPAVVHFNQERATPHYLFRAHRQCQFLTAGNAVRCATSPASARPDSYFRWRGGGLLESSRLPTARASFLPEESSPRNWQVCCAANQCGCRKLPQPTQEPMQRLAPSRFEVREHCPASDDPSTASWHQGKVLQVSWLIPRP